MVFALCVLSGILFLARQSKLVRHRVTKPPVVPKSGRRERTLSVREKFIESQKSPHKGEEPTALEPASDRPPHISAPESSRNSGYGKLSCLHAHLPRMNNVHARERRHHLNQLLADTHDLLVTCTRSIIGHVAGHTFYQPTWLFDKHHGEAGAERWCGIPSPSASSFLRGGPIGLAMARRRCRNDHYSPPPLVARKRRTNFASCSRLTTHPQEARTMAQEAQEAVR